MTAFTNLGRLRPALAPFVLTVLAYILACSAAAQGNPPGTAGPPPDPSAAPTRMLVLDASGSMWKNVDGTNRRSPLRAQLAAQFVDTFTAQLAQESAPRPLGMVRLGYRYPWTDKSIPLTTLCSDVELIVAPRETAAQTRKKIAYESGVGRKVDDDDYNPKGRTPLTLALQEAANAAPADGATLVVVTDLESDEKCTPDPCGEDGKPIAPLAKLFKDRNIRIRYVIAAGLIGAIGERAKRFATCFGAEYKVLENTDQAAKIGLEVGLQLIKDAAPPTPARGLLTVMLQNANGERLAVPSGSQLDVRPARGHQSVLRAPGPATVDPGRYVSSFTVGNRRWHVDDVEVAAHQQTEVAFIIAPSILRMHLIDSDYQRIDDEPDTVWEIDPDATQQSLTKLRVKGAQLSQLLPAGKYRVKIYTHAQEIIKEVTLEPGRELDEPVQVDRR
jgi:hypothetical protein